VQQERAGTEGVVAGLGAKCRELEKWLEENEWKAAALGAPAAAAKGGSKGKAAAVVDADAAAEMLSKLDVNKLVVPADDLCRQALAAQAEDLAVEDALTVLDKALQGGKVPVDAYIKQVRRGWPGVAGLAGGGGLGWGRGGWGWQVGVALDPLGKIKHQGRAALQPTTTSTQQSTPTHTTQTHTHTNQRNPHRSPARSVAASSSRAPAASKSRSCSSKPPRGSPGGARSRAPATRWCRGTAGRGRRTLWWRTRLHLRSGAVGGEGWRGRLGWGGVIPSRSRSLFLSLRVVAYGCTCSRRVVCCWALRRHTSVFAQTPCVCLRGKGPHLDELA